MTDAPERICAGPDSEHGWLHAHCSNVLAQDGGTEYIRSDLSAPQSEVDAVREENMRLKAELAEARDKALVEVSHLMPRYFGVWSSTGVHIGVWDDGPTAAKVLAEYPHGVMRDLLDVDAILALRTPTD